MIIQLEGPVATDKMTVEERYKIIRRVRATYRRASRGEKMQMLNTLQAATGTSRKHLIDLLSGAGPERKRRSRGRGRKYSVRLDDAIRLIGRLLNWICAERLQSVILRPRWFRLPDDPALGCCCLLLCKLRR